MWKPARQTKDSEIGYPFAPMSMPAKRLNTRLLQRPRTNIVVLIRKRQYCFHMSVQRLTSNIDVPRAVHEMLLPALVACPKKKYIFKIALTCARHHLEHFAQHTRIDCFLQLCSSVFRQVLLFIVAVCTYMLDRI